MAKAFRMISYGMIAVVFIKHLFFVCDSGIEVGTIQVFVVLGNMLISLVITKIAKKIGTINGLMTASFLQCLLGLINAKSDDSMLLMLTSLSGILSVTGG